MSSTVGVMSSTVSLGGWDTSPGLCVGWTQFYGSVILDAKGLLDFEASDLCCNFPVVSLSPGLCSGAGTGTIHLLPRAVRHAFGGLGFLA